MEESFFVEGTLSCKLVLGDLFEASEAALAHGCNCQGSMGAGIAVEFKHGDRGRGMKLAPGPRIGAGLGGLDWDQVRSLIETEFEHRPGTVTVYEA